MTDLYSVMGNPINHSKSPQIHSQFAAQSQQDMLYTAQLVPLEGFNDAADKFFRHGGAGLNITVPFKEDAFRFAGAHSERAKRAGAVNTLKKLEDGTIFADNTDGVGLVRDLTVNNSVTLTDKRILLLGAGGAVRGVLQPLLEQKPAELVIANRTVSKAQQLAADFADLGNVKGCGFEETEGSFDVIINGTSASLSGELPPVPPTAVSDTSVCYDMMYGSGLTVFNQWAHNMGAANTLDGLGMLVEQAAESFALWRGERPQTQDVIAELRTERRRR